MASRQDSYSPLGHDGEGVRYTINSFQDVADSPEVVYDPPRPERIPLIDVGTRRSVAWSPEPNDTGWSGHDAARRSSAPSPQDGRSIRSPAFDQRPKTLRRKPLSSYSLQNISKAWSHEFIKPINDPNRPHSGRYDFRRTRDKLFIACFSQWLITAVVAGAIAGALVGYQRWQTITNDRKHIFNAVMTGLAIALGINLASSLRNYATLLRWRLLSWSWLTLREFDLVLGCGSLLKIIELMLVTTPRRKFPFVSLIQFLCAVWLFVNVAVQILVAMLGLTYSLDQSPYDVKVLGNVSIVDFSAIVDPAGSGSRTAEAQQFAAHAYGIQGQDYPFWQSQNPYDEYGFQETYTDSGYNYVLYRFTDYNPSLATSLKSNRTITSKTVCNAYPVTSFQEPYFNGEPLPGTIAKYSDGISDLTLYVREWAYGATTYIADNTKICGPRCTRVYAYQAALNQPNANEQAGVDKNTIFDCNNTISDVTNATGQIRNYVLGDDSARWVAGAIGWTGYVDPIGTDVYEHLEYQLYSNDSYWSPALDLNANGKYSAASLISQFSMSAVAAMDNNGLTVNITDGWQPQNTLMVTVEWGNLASLLAAIVGVHFVTLLIVIIWANKAIIKDDSYLAISKLLAPTVMKLGPHGTVASGQKIAEAFGPTYKVFYGCRREIAEDGYVTMKADVLTRDQGDPKYRRPFPDGNYD